MPNLNETTRLEIESRYYFDPIRKLLEQETAKVGEINVLDHLTEVMQSATTEVEKVIQKRVKDGIINDASQARKSIAGNGFQALVAYMLIKLQDASILPQDLAITLKPKKDKLIEEYATIQVGDDVQKPDIDLLVYYSKKPESRPIVIYSIKTSLRERAGQTYRWKLLMDIATSKDCMAIKEKYGLSYQTKGDFKVGFITTNFYDEITKPQQRGMLRFFDFVYLTKPGPWAEPISNFSKIVEDLNGIYQ